MTEEQPAGEKEEQFAFYMDLVGHDILNNNQAVLGYLELILATPGMDKTVKKYAEKAVSHVRTSTLLVENIKSLLAVRVADPSSFKPIDLNQILTRSERELKGTYPGKKIRLRLSPKVKEACVIGNSRAEDLVLNALLNTVRMDREDDVSIDVTLRETEFGGKMCWQVRVEDKNAELPAAMRGKSIEMMYLQDSSTAVKLVGLLFAKMIASNLGGDFEAAELTDKGDRRGTAFIITLRKAGRP